MKKQICFILDWYPTKVNNGCVFAKHLICAIADLGYDCAVIAPRIISGSALQAVNRAPYKREETTKQGSKIRIFMPYYVHLSSNQHAMPVSMNNHYHAVMRTIRKEGLKPDAVYGHFIYQCGLTAARVGKALGIPAYCACGENSLRLEKGSKPYETGLLYCGWANILKTLAGVVCVSGNNEKLLRENHFIEDSMKTGVFPNAVDSTKFHPMDKLACRKELGFPEDAFIVAYTGTFSVNKGINRLSEALRSCENVHAIFMGKGSIAPDCDRILFQGSVPNDHLVKYLNAADVFVLPTRGEGCCNAIVEALACGLPVISSHLPFNDDILNPENSLRINIEDTVQLRESILQLYQDRQLLAKLAAGAKQSSEDLRIQIRAQRILDFMELQP